MKRMLKKLRSRFHNDLLAQMETDKQELGNLIIKTYPPAINDLHDEINRTIETGVTRQFTEYERQISAYRESEASFQKRMDAYEDRIKACDEQIQSYKSQVMTYGKARGVIQKIDDYCKTGDASSIDGVLYRDLFCVYDLFGADLYKYIIQKCFRQNERTLSKCDKIQVGFIFTVPYIWAFDSLYWCMERHERFEPFIIVMPPYNDMQGKHSYSTNLQLVREKGYRFIESFDLAENKYLPFPMIKQLGIVFHQLSYSVYPDPYRIELFPISTMNALVSYGTLTINPTNQFFYHNAGQRCFWKFLCETEFHVKINRDVLELGELNSIRCGIPRLDAIYDSDSVQAVLEQKKKEYSIVWAPHYQTSLVEGKAALATMDMNKDFFLDYAAKHPETYWYVRAHPNFYRHGVEFGLFENVEDIDAYLSKWAALDNAELALDMDVPTLFALSDMLITDSSTFLTDYLFFDKPLLRLIRGEEEDFWNEYGNLLVSHIPTVRGDDFAAIEEFVRTKPPMDKTLFDEYLDYYKYNGNKTAAEFFVEHLEELFWKEMGEMS